MSTVHALPEQKRTWGRFYVFRRTDGKLVVVDKTLPFGKMTVGEPFDTLDDAAREAERLSLEATALGEPNEKAKKGFLWDWGDPKTWER